MIHKLSWQEINGQDHMEKKLGLSTHIEINGFLYISGSSVRFSKNPLL